MKRLFIFLFLSSTFICSVYSNSVDTITAKTVATNFYLARISQSSQLKSRSLSEEGIELKLSHQEFDYATNLKSLSVPYYYVFNVNDNDGFVIVSADNRTVPILGYSFSGKFDQNDSLPPAFIEWMNHYKKQINYIRSSNKDPVTDINSEWSKYLTKNSLKSSSIIEEVLPLLSTEWDQTCSYNRYCPEDYSGIWSYLDYCGRVPVGC
ncbi:Spi family protease inhibitor, partial [Draconibacterium sp.]|uniref:Spi family protease inhibitor n=1 Tax=Draconibacterium sp. TaxID=1965318 RepID=UPI0035612B4B